MEIQYHTCRRCGHQWTQRYINAKPKCCPACKSYRWDTPKKDEPTKETTP